MYSPLKASVNNIMFSNTPYSEPEEDASPNNDTDWDWGFKANSI